LYLCRGTSSKGTFEKGTTKHYAGIYAQGYAGIYAQGYAGIYAQGCADFFATPFT
jgi:hypothetical protein